MNVFWRKEPLSDSENQLLQAVLLAHYNSCFRNNASSVAVINAAAGSGDLTKSIVAGLMTLGGKHAPLEQTVELLTIGYPRVNELLGRGEKIPGWGGSFQKDGPDPIWAEVAELLGKLYPALSRLLDWITEALHAEDKKIYPNPSAYTAASAIALKIPAKLAVFLFISGRLEAWVQLAIPQL